jgi:hypothetical protein
VAAHINIRSAQEKAARRRIPPSFCPSWLIRGTTGAPCRGRSRYWPLETGDRRCATLVDGRAAGDRGGGCCQCPEPHAEDGMPELRPHRMRPIAPAITAFTDCSMQQGAAERQQRRLWTAFLSSLTMTSGGRAWAESCRKIERFVRAAARHNPTSEFARQSLFRYRIQSISIHYVGSSSRNAFAECRSGVSKSSVKRS